MAQRARLARRSTASRVAPAPNTRRRYGLRLDTSQLPKPFQINAITNRDWNPQSEWKRLQLHAVDTEKRAIRPPAALSR